MINKIALRVVVLLLAAASSAFAAELTTLTVNAGGSLKAGDVLAGPFFNGSILYVTPTGVASGFDVHLVGADIPDAATGISPKAGVFATLTTADNYIRQRFVTNSIGTYVVVAADSKQPANAKLTILFVQGGAGVAGLTTMPDRVVLYGDSITSLGGDPIVQVDDCDWCAPVNDAGALILNAANNGARVSNQDMSAEFECNLANGYDACFNGVDQVVRNPISGVCQRGTVATPLSLIGDPDTYELTCAEDLGLSASDTVVYSLAINDIMQGQPSGFHANAPESFYDHMIDDFQTALDVVHYETAASCVITLMPPQWRGASGDATEYVQRNLNLREYQDDIVPIIAARYPRCVVVDVFQAFMDVETNSGEAAMLALYKDVSGTDTSVCLAKGQLFPPHDCLHPNVDGSALMGELLLAGIKEAHAKNLPGLRAASSALYYDFTRSNPFEQGVQSLDGVVYDAATTSIHTIGPGGGVRGSGTFVLKGVETSTTDQMCIAKRFGGEGTMESGCLFRQNRDGSGTVPVVSVSGSGLWRLNSVTGGTPTLLDDFDTSGGDFGNLGPLDCVGQTITGTGTDTVITSTLGDCSLFADVEFTPSAWPTCTGSLYGSTATAPGCTADVQVDFSTFTEIPGKGIGNFQEELWQDGTDGTRVFWGGDTVPQ